MNIAPRPESYAAYLMTVPRLGFLLLSLGLILPRLFGADSPATADSEEQRTGSETDGTPTRDSASAVNFPNNASPVDSGGEGGNAKSSSKIRRAVLGSFSYDPSVRAKSLEQRSSPVLVQPVETDPDLVIMPQLEVRARPYDQGLPAAIANWRDPRPRNDTKFGTGVREKDFGKVRASVVTILYVPVLLNFSW
jgi:hypothetical protein